MISFDRKVLKTIRKFTKNMNEPLCFYDNGLGVFDVSSGKGGRFIHCNIDSILANEAVDRLVCEGYLKYAAKFGGGKTFYITSKTVLFRQFWLDNLFQRFWVGFLSGILTTVVSELLIYLIRWLIAILFR